MIKIISVVLCILALGVSTKLIAQPLPCETVPSSCSVVCGCGPNGMDDYDMVACSSCLESGIPINTEIVYLLFSGIAFGAAAIKGMFGNKIKTRQL